MLYDERPVIKDVLESRKRLLANFLFKDPLISIAQSNFISSVDEIIQWISKKQG